MGDEVRLGLPPTPNAARFGREAVEVLATWDERLSGVVRDAQVVVSELVTYVLLNGRLDEPGDAITLAFKADDRHLRIDVDHRGSFARDARRRAALGLAVIDGLCQQWQADDGRITAWLAL
jgi:hypothetical protein